MPDPVGVGFDRQLESAMRSARLFGYVVAMTQAAASLLALALSVSMQNIDQRMGE